MPFLQFGRWSFLGLGVLYGAFHNNRLSKRENALREVEAKLKVERDAKLAAEKKERADKELKDLEALAR